jgi:hypothetical protein
LASPLRANQPAFHLCTDGGLRPPGHQGDLRKIVERIALLELKANRVEDPKEVTRQLDQAQLAFREKTMQQCVGKRITEGAIACINAATSAKQIVDQCFD